MNTFSCFPLMQEIGCLDFLLKVDDVEVIYEKRKEDDCVLFKRDKNKTKNVKTDKEVF